MAESIDRAPAKPSPAKKRRFQTFEKACHEKWPLVNKDGKGEKQSLDLATVSSCTTKQFLLCLLDLRFILIGF